MFPLSGWSGLQSNSLGSFSHIYSEWNYNHQPRCMLKKCYLCSGIIKPENHLKNTEFGTWFGATRTPRVLNKSLPHLQGVIFNAGPTHTSSSSGTLTRLVRTELVRYNCCGKMTIIYSCYQFYRGGWPVNAPLATGTRVVVPPLIFVDLLNLLQFLHGMIGITGELKRHHVITAFKKSPLPHPSFFIVNTI